MCMCTCMSIYHQHICLYVCLLVCVFACVLQCPTLLQLLCGLFVFLCTLLAVAAIQQLCCMLFLHLHSGNLFEETGRGPAT